MGKTDSLSDKVKQIARHHRYDKGAEPSTLPSFHTGSTGSTFNSNTGRLDEQNGRGSPLGPSDRANGRGIPDASTGGGVATTYSTDSSQHATNTESSAATPPVKSEAPGSGISTLDGAGSSDKTTTSKPPMTTRMIAGSKRFGMHTKDALLHSWVNLLLIFVPIGIVAKGVGLNDSIIFAMNAVAIIPLAGLLSHATESVASRLGDTIGALLNVTFGNAVELIIFIIALVKNEIRIVQASLLGSILANLLLILGMAFLFGGLRYREQIYNSTVTQMSACLLSLSVMSLLLPTGFHFSFNADSTEEANTKVLAVSRGTSVVLLLVYVLYLLFQLKSHAYMYESTPQEIIDEESHPGVLADMLNSSSSSDTSSSSSDSDSDSSGSHKTAGGRIKRLIKRRRRKSSASTATSTPSVPSVVSSPSAIEKQGSFWEGNNASPAMSRPATIARSAEGDDANDADGEAGRNGAPRVRDFGGDDGSVDASVPPKTRKAKKKAKKQRKHHRHRHMQEDENTIELEEAPNSAVSTEQAQKNERARVGFSADVEFMPSPATGEQTPAKRPFNMRGLSTRAPALRPGLSQMLSNTVFTTPPPTVAQTNANPVVRTRSSGLRRTSSLPDRLNRSNTPTSNAQSTVPSRHGPLPPYTHQAVRVRSENEEVELGEDEKPMMSRTAAVVMLLLSTVLVAICAEFMVDAIPGMIANSPAVSEAFIGLIILPIVGNAAEHVTAVTVATKNKMDLAIGVAVGSSIQIALFVTPVVVLLGWILKTEMSLYFNIFETISLFVTVFVVNFLVLDGRSNYLEGSLLIAAYVIIALAAFYYPSEDSQSAAGGASRF